ncbi:alanine--glyoxylate aminotransferase family protein [Herbiconiux sp. CPCC 203407]|uniref:Alanine--glyoxylate aminotransferase family protein n=1 Tax=Herbiconiux oxytropis TaxID=2970915 RepID=A0AA41XJ64_9MICO|nr:alanine--glyoxylate aminotransferase family protein [Herbiconiux oxytropis]MCS5722448.1 alanine--glyoxylate aminotransferase family protein [Herbiconiux oxytropis]MCS5727619.1 alanine--glyoxylate aminotransferase family protein [Herbiconiux oxytropis]
MSSLPINPPPRLLMGPGPINADPRVLRAMSAQLVGQYDPAMTSYMNETMALYREVFRTANEQTLLIDGTSRAGIEAAIVSLVAPGDRVLVPIFGRFGHLLREIAERAGAEVHVIEREWGTVFTEAEIERAIVATKPALLAVVHGDTSTTVAQPLEGLGALCEKHGVLFYTDVTASLAGNAFAADELGLDAVTAGLQKCLGGPSGSAPATFSPRAVEVIESRKSIEAGIASSADEIAASTDRRIRSNYFDLAMIFDYWGAKRLNHHTEATSMLYGARECARLLVEEGLANAVERHRLHGTAMLAGVGGLGLTVFGDLEHRMNNVVAVEIPAAVNGDAVRGELLTDFGIEIGTSFGPLHGKVWRIGTMGYNARKDAVLTTLAALEQVLRRHGAPVVGGGGVGAAYDVYQDAGAA